MEYGGWLWDRMVMLMFRFGEFGGLPFSFSMLLMTGFAWLVHGWFGARFALRVRITSWVLGERNVLIGYECHRTFSPECILKLMCLVWLF